MFRMKPTLAGLAAVAAIGAAAPAARAAHDSWYGYAVSVTNAQSSATGHDPWYGYANSLTNARRSVPFITDTLAPGGEAPVQTYRFIADTLAPGGGSSEVQAPSVSGFDWGDAGIGAGVTAGIALVLLGSVRLLHRRSAVAV